MIMLQVVNEPTDVHCPVVEIKTRSKLSCLSWNKFTKNHIASSDYDGIVTVWDVTTRQVGCSLNINCHLLLISCPFFQCSHTETRIYMFGLVQSIMEYEEHEKRAWSVDFSPTEPSMIVSGSDDCKVNFTFNTEFEIQPRSPLVLGLDEY